MAGAVVVDTDIRHKSLLGQNQRTRSAEAEADIPQTAANAETSVRAGILLAMAQVTIATAAAAVVGLGTPSSVGLAASRAWAGAISPSRLPPLRRRLLLLHRRCQCVCPIRSRLVR